MDQLTPLYERHLLHQGKMVSFAGYLLPIQYKTGVIGEHMAVREKCGLFDVSHMGEIRCTGKDAVENLNYLLTNDFRVMEEGQARYSPMCNEEGGIVDDLIVYKEKEESYFIVVNASNKEKDFEWFNNHAFGEVQFMDISSDVAQIAIQGPRAFSILNKLVSDEWIPKKYYHANFHMQIQQMECILSKTGYTGEAGYEIYLKPEDATTMWNLLLEAGEAEELIPCGLGARDTLRLEAAMPLYGHEMNEEVTPLEAGLDSFVKFSKEDFIGKKALLLKENRRKRVGIKITGAGIAREQYDVYVDEKRIGHITSGTHSPYFKYPIAMALLDRSYSEIGTKITVDVRGRRVEGIVVELPFYKKEK